MRAVGNDQVLAYPTNPTSDSSVKASTDSDAAGMPQSQCEITFSNGNSGKLSSIGSFVSAARRDSAQSAKLVRFRKNSWKIRRTRQLPRKKTSIRQFP